MPLPTPAPIDSGVFRIPLDLSPSLESDRPALEAAIVDAQRRLRAFAECHGWQDRVADCFADRAVILDSKAAFDGELIRVLGLDPETSIPPSACAALEQRVLMAVSPGVYAEMYPPGVEEGSFEKLLCHEMAHRLHIRVLDGDEDAMGPIWFFEGFAIHAADQFAQSSLDLSVDEIRDIVGSDERGSYEQYAFVIRHFLRDHSLPDLVAAAASPDFHARLLPG